MALHDFLFSIQGRAPTLNVAVPEAIVIYRGKVLLSESVTSLVQIQVSRKQV